MLFHRALETLLTSAPEAALLEIGPGAVLARLTARHPANAGKAPVAASLASGREEEDEYRSLLEAAGTLWSSGVPINWRAFYAGDRRRKIPLPTYPFERRKYWIEPGKTAVTPDLPQVSEMISPENAPRSASEAERQVLELMREILGVSFLSPEDDFFKVGGDSLTAVQLAARLEERFGVTVPRHALLTGATAAQLARMLPKGALAQETPQALPENRESTAQGPENIVGGTSATGLITLRKGDVSATPLVFIPAIGGGAFIYRELATQLETTHPIHAFEAPGLWDDRAPLESVEALAAHFLQQLRAALPAQRPILAGSSFGGMVVWEMARQLAACGTPPPAVLMIDTPGPGHLPKPLADDAEILAYLLAGDDPDGRFVEHCRKLRSIAPEKRIAYAAQALETGLEEREMMRILKVYRANLRAMFSYCPQAFGERVIFLRAKEPNAFTAPHPELAWAPLAEGGMEILPIAGNHATMLTAAHAPQLAATIKKALGL